MKLYFNSRDGFTLAEVMIAIIIFCFISATFAFFILTVSKQEAIADVAQIAMNAAQGQIEKIRNLVDPDNPGEKISFDNILNAYNTHTFTILNADGAVDSRFQGAIIVTQLNADPLVYRIQITITAASSRIGVQTYSFNTSIADVGASF